MKTLIILFGILFVGIESFIYIYGKKEECVDVDYILVLGCGLYGDRLSPALIRRLNKSLEYYREHPETSIIVSGGKGDDEKVSEAHAMKEYLIQNDVEPSKIIMEDKSVSTYTNFLFTKQLLGSSNYRMLVTTCDFHMYRSIVFGNKVGFTCFRWPAKSTTVFSVKNFIREFFCILYMWVVKK